VLAKKKGETARERKKNGNKKTKVRNDEMKNRSKIP